MAASPTFRGVFYGHRTFEDRMWRSSGLFQRHHPRHDSDQIRFVHADVAIADIATVVSNPEADVPGVQARADGTIHTRYSRFRDSTGTVVASYHNVDVKAPERPSLRAREKRHRSRRSKTGNR